MASAIKGEDRIAGSWIGEGRSAEADFHHGMTFAAVYRAPVILNIVNNQWAISTFQGFAGGEQRSFARADPATAFPASASMATIFWRVYAVTQWAAERARQSGGPTLIEPVTYRAAAHSTSDDPARYRPKDEWRAWPLGDPVERLKQHLIVLGEWSEQRHAELRRSSRRTSPPAGRRRRPTAPCPVGPRWTRCTMFEDVFKEMPPNLVREREELRALQESGAAARPASAPLAQKG